MKKTFFIGLLTVLITSAYAQTGVIREMSGDVELKPAGAAAFVKARAGAQIAQDTVVSTGFKSTAVIVVGSSVITVRPLTRLSLKEIQGGNEPENLNVNLQTGRVRVEVRPPAGTRAVTTVSTPSATASVRGTVFEMDTRNLDVVEGRVMFHGADGLPVPVSGGDASAVSDEGGSRDPVEIAETNLLPLAPQGSGEAGEAPVILPPPPTAGDVFFTPIW